MNRYRITALEEVDVEITAERPVTIRVRGASRQVMSREPPHWVHLDKGDVRDVVAVLGIRGDLLGEGTPPVHPDASEAVVVHGALRIEALPALPASREEQS